MKKRVFACLLARLLPVIGLPAGSFAATAANDLSFPRTVGTWEQKDGVILNRTGFGRSFAMTEAPLETTLRTVDGQPMLCSYPIAELETLRAETLYSGRNVTVSEGQDLLRDVQAGHLDLVLKMDVGTATGVDLVANRKGNRQLLLHYDVAGQTLTVDRSAVDGGKTGKVDAF